MVPKSQEMPQKQQHLSLYKYTAHAPHNTVCEVFFSDQTEARCCICLWKKYHSVFLMCIAVTFPFHRYTGHI